MNRKRLLVVLGLVLAGAVAADQSVTLAWDPNPEPDVAGYIVYYGTVSRNYPFHTNVGNVTTATIYGLREGVTYYFAIAATNSTGLESDFSNEITNHIPSLETLATWRQQGKVPPAASAPQPRDVKASPPPAGSIPTASSETERASSPGFPKVVADRLRQAKAWVRSTPEVRRLLGLVSSPGRVVSLALGLACGGLAVMGLLALRRYRSAIGTVQERRPPLEGASPWIVAYPRDDGTAGTWEPGASELPSNCGPGTNVQVLYHRNRRDVARLYSRRERWRLWRSPLLAGGLAIACAAAAGLLAWPLKQTPATAKATAAESDPAATASRACRSRLEFIGLAVQLWAFDHGGGLPTNVLNLQPHLGEPAALVCPADTGNPLAKAKNWDTFEAGQSTYELSFPGVPGGDSVTVIARCRRHGHILHATLMSAKVMEVRK